MRLQKYYDKKISASFYQEEDVVSIAKSLLGKFLCTLVDKKLTKGKIVETEAYSYLEKGCHAYSQRKTKRTAPMFENGGISYVYLCYGVHSLFNIVTNKEGFAEAVLIRAVEPTQGIEYMFDRRNISQLKALSSGPGKLTKALGISLDHDGIDLNGDNIWLEEGTSIEEKNIVCSERIGIDYAGKDALLPWRFYIKDNDCISKK